MADNWAYFCEDSGYFVHIDCATTLSASGEKFEMNCEDKNHGESYLELLHFPLPSTDSLTAILVEEYQSSNRIKELEDDSDFDGDDDEEEKEVEEEEKEEDEVEEEEEEEEEEVEEEDKEEDEVEEEEEEEEEEVQEDSLVINHWSHLDHPLILLEELKDIHNDESDRIHDIETLLLQGLQQACSKNCQTSSLDQVRDLKPGFSGDFGISSNCKGEVIN
ncbi:hypothetical protein ACET3Z_012801 [Daucus carota]